MNILKGRCSFPNSSLTENTFEKGKGREEYKREKNSTVSSLAELVSKFLPSVSIELKLQW